MGEQCCSGTAAMPMPAFAPTDPDPDLWANLPACPQTCPTTLSLWGDAGLRADAGYHHPPCPPCSHGDGYHAGLPTTSPSFLPSNEVPPRWCWICAHVLAPDHKHRHSARSSIAMHYCYTSACTRDRENKLKRCCQAWWLPLSTESMQTGLYVKWRQKPKLNKGHLYWVNSLLHRQCMHVAVTQPPGESPSMPPSFYLPCSSRTTNLW